VNILVTAGNSVVPIDKVRCITNIFTGRTGAQIALAGQRRGHRIVLLTSHPDVIAELNAGPKPPTEHWQVCRYRTFDDLQAFMAEQLGRQWPQAVIHAAAVSDYRTAGIFAPDPQTRFDQSSLRWEACPPAAPGLIDLAADKVKSDAAELWLRLVRTPKLIDFIRIPWGFSGVLVKFKLEVGVTEERLLQIAEHSRCQSAADLMVANTLEGSASWAYLGPLNNGYERIERSQLADRLLDEVERLHGEQRHG
jgi:phosphopantothenate---cysteine ligase (CTP)